MRRLLPDFMVPYKHYEVEAITDVLDEVITDDPRFNYPSAQTMRRWLLWYLKNENRVEGIFRSVGYRMLGFGEELLFQTSSLLHELRFRTDDWLKITVRLIYNSGNYLLPL